MDAADQLPIPVLIMKVRSLIVLFTFALVGSPCSAQTLTELLASVGKADNAEQRAEILLSATKAAASINSHEDVNDLATLCVQEGQGSDRDDIVANALLLLSRSEARQGSQTRSLSNALKAYAFAEDADISTRSEITLWLARSYMKANVAQRALDYAELLLDLQGVDPGVEEEALWIAATSSQALGDGQHARNAYADIIKRAQARKDQETLFKVYSALSALEVSEGRYEDARRFATDLLILCHTTGEGTDRGIVLNNLGELDLKLNDHAQALDHFREAATWLYDMPDLYERVLINTAVAYAELGQYTTAMSVVENAMLRAERHKLGEILIRSKVLKASIALLDGQFSESRAVATEAELLAHQSGRTDQEIEALNVLLHLARKRNFHEEAQQLEKRLNKLLSAQEERSIRDRRAEEDRVLLHQKQEREILDMVYKEKRDRMMMQQVMLDAENQSKEMDILRYEKELQESLIRQEALARERAQQELTIARTALDAERNARTIEQLEGQQSLQMLRVTRLELEQKQRSNALEMLRKQNDLLESDRKLKLAEQRRDRIISRAAIAGGLLMLLATVAAFTVMRKMRQKNRVIRDQVKQIGTINDELASKNADLMDSITYARTIQSTIVPTTDEFRSQLPDSFLFYRPRDLVSGDLPFMLRIGDRLYVAAVDCTGHGVPAAMLSFIAYYNLNEIIRTRPGIGMDEVLHELHIRVLQTIGRGQEGERLSDGMDIGLCRIDVTTGELTFAGAQMSLLIERSGNVTRVKGDVRAIGDRFGYGPPTFTEHHFLLGAMDRAYLFSDGIIHQFGGENGRKKFSYARLMELVQDLASHDQESSLQHVTATFQNWKQEMEQTDDVLLIGFSLRGLIQQSNAA